MKVSCNGRIPDSVTLPSGRLLLAFSGGDDSLALLSVLSEKASDRSAALYVNHALRSEEELEEEEIHNRENARLLGIPLSVARLERGAVEILARHKGIGIEAAARELRYRVLHEYREDNGFDWILTAHHRDDQAETVAMRMLSSSPFYAWGGIRRCDGFIYRPLLGFPKAEILSYLQSRNLIPSVDSTNSDTAYRRNAIRHFIMPSLSESAKEMMAQIAENIASYREKFSLNPLSSGFYISYDRHLFVSSPRFLIDQAVYDANAAFGGERVSRAMISSVLAKAEDGRGRLETSGMVFLFTQSEVRIYPQLRSFAMPFGIDAAMPCGAVVSVPPASDDLTLRVRYDKLIPPVIIRDAREGDAIWLKGGRKKISELMKDQRVPYSIVVEDREGIAICFMRLFGGRDRLSRRLLGEDGEPIALALIR